MIYDFYAYRNSIRKPKNIYEWLLLVKERKDQLRRKQRRKKIITV